MPLNYQLAGALPGFHAELSTSESEITWGKTEVNDTFVRPVLFDSSARDAGNTPTTILRAGLVLACDKTNIQAGTFAGTTTDLWTITGHGFSLNDEVYLEGSDLTNQVDGGPYYVVTIVGDTFQLALTPSGTPLLETIDGGANVVDYTRRKFRQWEASSNWDKASAILLFDMDMQQFGVDSDKFMGSAMFGGQVRASKIFDDASGTPGTLAAAARTDLLAVPFWIDDEPFVA